MAKLERQVQELSARLEADHDSTSGSVHPMMNVIQSAPSQISVVQTTLDGRLAAQHSASTDETVMPGTVGHSHGERTFILDSHVYPSDDHESVHEIGEELRDVNQHTKSIEFHGNTSSMAFLALVQNQN